MRTSLALLLAMTLLALVATAIGAQEPTPPTPVPAPAPASPPPTPQGTLPAPEPKPIAVFQEVINIDNCLSANPLADGKGEICKTANGVTVTAVVKAGDLKALVFRDPAGHGVTLQVRPDPVPSGRCYQCTSDPKIGFSCTKTICAPAAPAKPAK